MAGSLKRDVTPPPSPSPPPALGSREVWRIVSPLEYLLSSDKDGERPAPRLSTPWGPPAPHRWLSREALTPRPGSASDAGLRRLMGELCGFTEVSYLRKHVWFCFCNRVLPRLHSPSPSPRQTQAQPSEDQDWSPAVGTVGCALGGSWVSVKNNGSCNGWSM